RGPRPYRRWGVGLAFCPPPPAPWRAPPPPAPPVLGPGGGAPGGGGCASPPGAPPPPPRTPPPPPTSPPAPGCPPPPPPPPPSAELQSKSSTPPTPPVRGLQIDGYFPDACNAFQAEPALVAKDGSPFIPGCTPPPVLGQTCLLGCHHDGQFVLRIPDSWDGHLLSAGTPGIRDAFASDFILSDYALEKRWAYVSQDKGNMGANFFRSGTDESGTAGTPWVPGAAIREWTVRMRQATRAARALLTALAHEYGLKGVTRSYIAGISNGG